MLEKEIERRLVDPIRSLGGLCWKLTVPGCTGVPDRILLLPGGQVRFVEFKRPGEKERPRQRLVQDRLRRLGFVVYSTVCTAAQIDMIVEECREAVRGGEAR
jgi:hypothetical protein